MNPAGWQLSGVLPVMLVVPLPLPVAVPPAKIPPPEGLAPDAVLPLIVVSTRVRLSPVATKISPPPSR
jgi:hypothetical protein